MSTRGEPNKASSLVKITAYREPMRVEVVRAALSPFQLETPYCYGRVTAAWASKSAGRGRREEVDRGHNTKRRVGGKKKRER